MAKRGRDVKLADPKLTGSGWALGRTPQQQRSPWKVKGHSPTLDSSAQASCARKIILHNIWHWKSARIFFISSGRIEGSWKPRHPFKEPVYKFINMEAFTLGSSRVAAIWEVPETYRKSLFCGFRQGLERQLSLKLNLHVIYMKVASFLC